MRTSLQESINLVRPLAEQRSITLTHTIQAGCETVPADYDRLMQVLYNLIGNAVKFTQSSGTVTVSVTAVPNALRFSVLDNGPGIAQKDLPFVFDRFWRSKQATATGTGLGLAIVKGIVAAHGGKVWVKSTVGSGSEFCFTLPKSECEI